MAAFGAWLRAWRHLNRRGYLYVWANVAWVVLTLPIITAPAAWAGLSRFSYLAFRNPTVSLSEFWQGFRENLGRGVLLALADAVIVVINVGNLIAYRGAFGVGVDALRILWTLALLIWFSAQFFLWPLFYSMERPSLIGALRNSAVLMLRNPLFTVVTWVMIALVAAVSTILPVAWLLLTGSALAVASNSLVIDRLRAAGYARDLPLEDETPPDDNLYGDVLG